MSDFFSDTFGDAWNGLVNGFDTFVGGATSAVNDLGNAIATDTHDLFHSIGEGLDSLGLGGVVQVAETTFDEVVTSGEQAVALAVTNPKEFLDEYGHTILDIAANSFLPGSSLLVDAIYEEDQNGWKLPSKEFLQTAGAESLTDLLAPDITKALSSVLPSVADDLISSDIAQQELHNALNSYILTGHLPTGSEAEVLLITDAASSGLISDVSTEISTALSNLLGNVGSGLGSIFIVTGSSADLGLKIGAALIQSYSQAQIIALAGANVTEILSTDSSVQINSSQAKAFEAGEIRLSTPNGGTVSIGDTAAQIRQFTPVELQALASIGVKVISVTDNAQVSLDVAQIAALENANILIQGNALLEDSASNIEELTVAQIADLKTIGITKILAHGSVAVTAFQLLAIQSAGLNISVSSGSVLGLAQSTDNQVVEPGSTSAGTIGSGSQSVTAASFSPGSYISTGTNNLPSGSAARSVFAWVDYTGGSSGYIYNYGTRAGNELTLLSVNNGKLYFGGFANDFASTLAVTPDAWHFVGFTYDGANTVTLTVDDQSQSGTVSPLNTVLNGSIIGAALPNLDAGWPGSIINLQVYNGALDNIQTLDLYLQGKSGAPLSLPNISAVSWWPLSGSAVDEGPAGNTGSATDVSYGTATFSNPDVQTLTAGTSVLGTTITSGGMQIVQSGAAATQVSINGGDQYIESGGTATNTAVDGTPQNLNLASFSPGNPGSYIETPENALPTGSASRSVFAWVDFGGASGAYDIYAYGTNYTNVSFLGATFKDARFNGEAQFGVYNGDLWFSAYGNDRLSPLSVTPNQWHLVGYTYNSGSYSVTLTVDGHSDLGPLGAGVPINTILDNTSESVIGAELFDHGAEWNGWIANLQVYDVALSDSQVQALYQDGIAGSPIVLPNTDAWWPLNGNANDASGHGNDGTPTDVSYLPTSFPDAGYQYVLDGATTSGTTINNGGVQVVNGGGTAVNTTVNQGGYQQVQSGGTASGTTINSGGIETVFGSAPSTTVNSGGTLQLHGGINGDTLVNVNSGGTLDVFGGAPTPDGFTISAGGNLEIDSGYSVTDYLVSSGVTLTVAHGGTIGNTTVLAGGTLELLNETNVTGVTTIASGGSLVIGSGSSSPNGIVVESGGTVEVSGGKESVYAGDTDVGIQIFGGEQNVFAGGESLSATIHSGSQQVESGGTATDTVIDSGGYQYVEAGGTATDTVIDSGGYQQVEYGGTANGTVINSGGLETVLNLGFAPSTTVNNGGRLELYGGADGGTLVDVTSGGTLALFGGAPSTGGFTIGAGGTLEIDSGYTLTDYIVSSGVTLAVTTGGTISNTTVLAGGTLELLNEADVAGVTTIASGGSLVIGSGFSRFVPSSIVLSNGATVEVVSGGTEVVNADGVDVGVQVTGGSLIVSAGGESLSTTIHSGSQQVESGGTATDTVIDSGGLETVLNLGFAPSTTVNNGGRLELYGGADGGTLVDVTSGGTLALFGGAPSTGGFTIGAGGTLEIDSGYTLTDYIVSSGVTLAVTTGGTISNTTVLAGGTLELLNEADVAGVTTIAPGGSLVIGSGFSRFVPSSIVLSNGATVEVVSGGTEVVNADGVDVGVQVTGGSLIVSAGGESLTTTINNGGSEIVSTGAIDSGGSQIGTGEQNVFGIASGATITSGGMQIVQAGGTANGSILDGGNQYIESGGTAVNGTIGGGSQSLTAASFSPGSYISTGTNNLPSGSAARSVFAWVDYTGGSSGYIYDYGTRAGNELTLLSVNNGKLYFGGFANDFASTLPVTPDAWHFVGFTYDGANTVTLTVDNQSQFGTVSPLNTVLNGSIIGAALPFLNATWPGSIANLQVYNVALSSSQILALYNDGIASSPLLLANAAAWWPLNGNASDVTLNGNNGLPADVTYLPTSFIDDGNQYVMAGGTASGVTIVNGGEQTVNSGGTASDTIINNGGSQQIENGGTAIDTVIDSGGLETVLNNGLAPSTIVNGGGTLQLYGGVDGDTGVDVRSGGTLDLFGGAPTVDGFTVSAGATLVVEPSYTLSNYVISSGVTLEVASGGTIVDTSVLSGGNLQVLSGASVRGTTSVENGGNSTVDSASISGGTLSGLTLSSGTNLTVGAGGVVSDTTVIAGGTLELLAGATLSGTTTISSGGTEVIGSGYTLNNFTVNNGATLEVASGGEADGTMVASGGLESVDGTATSTVISSGGTQYVNSGAAINTAVLDGGTQYVFGQASGTTVNSSGFEYIFSGGNDSSASIEDGGYQYVLSGGTASDAVLNDPGTQIVAAGGLAIGALVSGGKQEVYGTASNTIIESGGFQEIQSGGGATGTIIASGGVQTVYGSANNTTVNSGGTEFVSSGGIAVDTAINGGVERVVSGGSATNVSFTGADGSLVLDDPSELIGTISNWQIGDTIDFVNTTITAAAVNGSTLTITGPGNKTFAYQMVNLEPGSVFTLQHDSSGQGTDLHTLLTVEQSDPSPTNASSVHYTLTFRNPVTGVDASQFSTVSAGISGASITNLTPISGSNGAQYSVTVGTGSGDGSLGIDYNLMPAAGYPAGEGPEYGPAIADVTGDGIPDLIVPDNYGNGFSVLLGNGDGTFQNPIFTPTGVGLHSVAIGDVNGDGIADVVVENSNSGTVSVLLGNGNGTFQPPTASYLTGSGVNGLALGDLNGDGNLDIVTANQDAGTVSVLLGYGNGTFQQAVSYAAIQPGFVAISDLNGDGQPDLVVSDGPSTVSVLINNGDGTFDTAVSYNAESIGAALAVGYLTGNGEPDIVVPTSNGIAVLLNNGNGTFGAPIIDPVGSGLTPWAIADVNGDGKPDLIVTNAATNTVSVLLGNGDGTFGQEITYPVGSYPISAAIADLDGNGRPDIVTGNLNDNTVSVLLNVAASGSAYTIDKDTNEQAALSLSFVDTTVQTSQANAVHFMVGGLEAEDSAVITFKDHLGASTTKSVSTNGTTTVDLTGLTDGTITASLQVATDPAGNSFNPVAATNIATLDQDSGEQATLKLTVTNTDVGANAASTVPFAVAGLESDDSGTVTFTDANNKTVVVNVSGGTSSYTANLTSLTDGTITSSMAINTDPAGNTFTSVAGTSITLDQDLGEQAITLNDPSSSSTTNSLTSLYAYEGPISGTDPFGINNAGQISGTYVDGSGITHGFLYSGGNYTTIDDPSASSFGTIVRGINDTGQIVGYDITNANDLFAHSFLYSGGVYTPINDPSALAGSDTFAFGINNADQIVGYYVNGQEDPHGFLYSGGVYTTLNDPVAYAGGISTNPFSINSAGQIVGLYSDASGVRHGFLYSGGVYTTIDDPLRGSQTGGNAGTHATGINDAGQIVGWYKDSSGIDHGFLDVGGIFTTIDDPFATGGTQITGINNAGQITGYYSDATGTHGFLTEVGSVELSLTITDTLVGAAGANTVHYSVAGLDLEDTGSVTFADAASHKVTVNVNGGQTNYTANLTSLTDGTITSSLALNTDPAGNTFKPVPGNSITLDQDTAEQSALSVAVNGGSPIGHSLAPVVPFTLTGVESDDTGTVTFSDGIAAHNVVINIVGGVAASTTANLSGLNDGPVTATLHLNNDPAGNSFNPVAATNIATLDQDSGEQATLKLTVTNTDVGANAASTVPFAVAGLESDDSGTVTFTDANNKTVVVNVSGGTSSYTANLTSLTDGTITSSMAINTDPAGNTFTSVAGTSITLDQDLGEQAITLNDPSSSSTTNSLTSLYAYEGPISGTDPFGINNAGQISGTYVDGSGITHGFLYSGGNYTTIDDPSASSFGTIVRGINDTGQIVGYDITNANDLFAHSFLYSGGVYTPINDPSALAGSDTFAFGINNADQIVGYYVNGQEDPHGFLYSGGVYTTLNDPVAYAGGISTNPFSINSAGQIVGLYSDASGVRHGFLYSGGVYTTIDDPLRGSQTGGNAGTHATGINDAGQIVGWYKDSSGIDHGFLDVGGIFTTIDDPFATGGTQITGINNAGQITGYYSDATGTHGFLTEVGSVELSLTITDTLVGAAGANTVHYSVAGLDLEDTGSVTFADAASHKVTVNVNGGQTNYTANLTSLTDGTITSSLALNTDPAGNTFKPVPGNSITLDQDTAEQSALSVAVNGGSPIGHSLAPVVPFTLTGVESDDTGTVTFSDGIAAHNVVINIVGGVAASTTANLSGLNDGPVTATLHLNNDPAGNSFTDVVVHPTLVSAAITWANGISGIWQTATDWSPNTVPGLGNSVFITPPGTYTVTDPQTTTVNSVVTTAGATLDITGGTFTINGGTGSANAGTITVESGAALNIKPGTVTNSGTLNNAGTLDLNTTTITGGTLGNAGTVDVTGGTTTTLTGVSVTNAGGSGASAGVLALDGNGFANKATPSASAGVTLTTSNANDVIILDIVQNGTTVSSVTDTAGLVWHQRAVAGAAPGTIYEYYAIAANALSADAITVNFAGTAGYVDLNAFGVSGANTASPFDGNASDPATAAAATASISTSNANDLILAGYRFGGTAAPTAGAGWTAINASGDYYLSEYRIVSATQAGLAATASASDENGGIIDALVQAPAIPPTPSGALTVDAGSTLDLNNTTIGGGVLGNAGTVDVTGGATSTFKGTSVTNTSATVMVDAGATLDLNASTISGGALSNAGTVDVSGGVSSTLTGVAVSGAGTVTVDAGTALDLNASTLGGTLSNAGTLDVTGGTTSTLSGASLSNTSGMGMASSPLALDGSGFANFATNQTSSSVKLTTSKTNDVIILDIVQNGTSVSSITDASGLTWHLRAVAGTSPTTIYEYYAIAPSVLSADTITVNFAGTAGYVDLNAFGVSGANTSSPFDANASDPATPTVSTGSITTSNANDLIIAGYRFGGTASATAGAGWTAIHAGAGYYLSEYQVVSATQAGLVATASASDQTGGIVDAIVQATAPVATGGVTVEAGSTLDLNNTTITGGTLNNAGTVDAIGGVTSTLSGVSVTDTSATVMVDAGSTLDLINTTISGGTLSNAGTLDTTGSATSTLKGVAVTGAGGTVRVDAGSTLDLNASTLGGKLNNAGTVDVTGSATSALSGVSATDTGGTLKVDAGKTLDLAGTTITGGTLGNAGTVDVNSGSASTLTGVGVTDTSATLTVDASATLDLNTTTITGGTLGNAGTVDVTGGTTTTLTGVSVTNAGGSGASAGVLALDGNGFANKATPSASAGVTLTTSNANDVIILDIVQNGTTVSSVTDTAGLVWHQRAVAGAAPGTIYEYYAIAANALSADAITVNFAGTAGYVDLNAFGVSGANTASPFDGNASDPATAAAATASISTSNANDLILAGYRFGGTAAPTAGAGWTAINASGDYYLSEYRIVSATQAGLAATASASDENGGIIDALVQAPAIPPTPSGALTVDAGSTLDLNNTTIGGGVLGNAGTVDVTGGATSTFKGTSVTNTSATVMVDAGATLDLNASTISGGALSNAGTVDVSGGVSSTLTGVAVSGAGTVTVDAGTALDLNASTLGGTLSNAGTLDVTGGTTSTLSGASLSNTSGMGMASSPLALDGSGFANFATNQTSSSVKLTTSKTNDVIILDIVQNGTSVSSITDASGLTWHLRAVAGTSPTTIYEYYAIAPSVLSADTITVNFAGTAGYVDLNAFGVSGANTSSPFDANASDPATPTVSTGSITTSNANDLIIAGYRFGGTASATAGAGWTAIHAGAGYYLSEYQVVSATQAGLVATASASDQTGGIVDAIVQATAPVATGGVTVEAGSTLDLNNTTITGGTLNNAGTVDAIGGVTSTLSGVSVTDTSATVMVDAGSTLDLINTTISGGTLSNAGTLDTTGSATSTLKGVAVTGAGGTVRVDAGSTLDLNASTLGGKLNNAGTVDVTGSATSALSGVSATDTGGTLKVDAGKTLDLAGTTITGGTLGNAGTVDVNSGSASTLTGVGVTDTSATLTVDASATLDLNTTTITGGTLGNAGTVDVTGGTTTTLTGVSVTNAGGSGASAGVLALDGNGFANKATPSASAGVTLTTSNANDVIILDIVQNGTTVSSVTDTAGLVWHQRAVAGAAPGTIYEYYAIAANALSADAITVNFAGTAGYVDLNAFGVSGANTASPFDGNASDPATAAAATASISTSNANDLILAGYRFGGTAAPTAGAGWTAINASGDYYLSEYRIVSATQAGLAATASASDENGGIIDALVQAPAIPPTPSGALTVDAGSTLDLNNTTIGGGVLGNAGTVDVTGGATSTFKGTSVTNTSATVMVDAGATLDLNASTISGGALSNAGTVDVSGGVSSTLTGVAVSGAGTVTVDAGTALDLNASTLGGTLSNAGTLDVTGGTTSTLSGASLSNTSGMGMASSPLALDGSGFANFATNQTSSSVKLTTSKTNDVIILDIVQNGTSVSSITDASGLTWHLRAVAGTSPTTIYEYYAIAPSVLSADTITVNFAGTAGYVDLNAFGVSGANTSSPFDANASDPATPTVSTGSITTSNANDLIIAGYRFGGTASATAGAGWTAIHAGAGYYLSEYQVVSATQAGLVATASASDQTGGIVDAIVQATAPVATGGVTVEAGSTLDLNNTTITGGTLNNAGTVDAIGGVTSTLSGVSVTNSGTFEATDGMLTASGPVTNTGNLLASNGATLDITGAASGNGTATISGTNSILEFGAASAENTTFSTAVDAMLKLDNASGFTGTVAGLATGDSIDLANFLFSGNPIIAGVTGTGAIGTTTDVTVHDQGGAQSVTLHLLNQSASQFAVDPTAYSLVADNNAPNHGTLFQLAAPV